MPWVLSSVAGSAAIFAVVLLVAYNVRAPGLVLGLKTAGIGGLLGTAVMALIIGKSWARWAGAGSTLLVLAAILWKAML